MSWLPDSPAFLGFHPPVLAWHEIEHLDAISHQSWWSALPFPSKLEQLFRLETHHKGDFGFYRFKGEEFDWFVKLVPPNQAQRNLQADNIARHLQENKIHVSRLLEGFPLELSDHQTLLAYDYLPGRFLIPQRTDLVLLGKAIAELHLALETLPEREQVKQLGLARHNALKQVLNQVKSSVKAELPKAVRQIFEQVEADELDVLIEGGQCVHGDLNLGNVWLANNHEFTFLDFEDSLTAWFNPMKDLAFVLERFILTHDGVEHEKLALTFLRSYYMHHNHRFNHPEHLMQLLKALSIRALLLLIDISSTKKNVLSEEWKKFVFLYNLADKNRELLESILCQAAENP